MTFQTFIDGGNDLNIQDQLKEKRFTLSFEVFPPKTDVHFESVKAATEKIAALNPGFVSVTYGAGGGTSEYTLAIAKNIREKYKIPVLAHLTCVSSTKASVADRIAKLKEAGIQNVMALRGDIPAEMQNQDRSHWEYQFAYQLVEELKQAGDFCIGGACYPEIHPESDNQRADLRHLKEKVDAGCDFLTTQMFFDNNLFYNFLFKIREAGISVPVLPGIMPITNAKQVERAITLSGSLVPQRFKSLVDRFGSDPDAMKQAGIAYATDQIIDLFSNGIYHIHVYTMNKPDVAEQILNNLSSILGKSL